MLRVAFLDDNPVYDREFEKTSIEITQPNSRSKDDVEWRKSLKVDDTVDFLDKAVWTSSTILDMKVLVTDSGREFT